jgi:hypothetical protein
MKNIFLTILCCLFSFFVIGQTSIELINTTPISRENEVVEIPWELIKAKYANIDTTALVIINKKTKEPIVYQFEFQGKKEIQNLLVQVSFTSLETIKLLLSKGPRPVFTSKAYCRYVPERKDDFAWENDRIAFRMYGKALEQTPNENSYGTDVWSKRTRKMILNEWYKRNKYHEDNGDGLDFYHVGYFLGAGDIAPYSKDSIWYPKNYTSWKVLDNGPLRCSFELDYDSWKVDGETVTVTKSISLDAGSQLNKVNVVYSFQKKEPLSLAVGISRRAEAGTMLLDEKSGLLGYWEPTHGKDGTIGVACVIPSINNKMTLTKGHLLSIFESKSNQPLIYYKGAAWDKAGDITSASAWFNYLKEFNLKIASPILIK